MSSCNKESARQTSTQFLEACLDMSFRVCYGVKRMDLIVAGEQGLHLLRASLNGLITLNVIV